MFSEENGLNYTQLRYFKMYQSYYFIYVES